MEFDWLGFIEVDQSRLRLKDKKMRIYTIFGNQTLDDNKLGLAGEQPSKTMIFLIFECFREKTIGSVFLIYRLSELGRKMK